jgi:surface protein
MTHLNTSNVTDVGEMFANCSSLTVLDLSSFDCRNLTDAEGMFTNCTNLQTIYITDGLGNLDHGSINDQWMFTYCYSLSGGAGAVYVTNTGYDGACGRIDTGGIGTAYFSPAFNLANETENNSVLYQFRNCFKAKATLADRTLYKDNSWNTICLPFDVDLTDANSPLCGATVMELDTEAGTYDHVTGFDNGTLYLNFKDVTTTMTAGTPYIIKWASGNNLVNPSFLPVNINNTTNNVTSTDGKVTFTGTYAPVSITSTGDNTKLYLGSDNTIYYPDDEMTIGCQRAYFQLNGITIGDPATGVKAFVLNFGDDDETFILSPKGIGKGASTQGDPKDSWFDLSGRRLNDKPSLSGLYIVNGKKIMIK